MEFIAFVLQGLAVLVFVDAISSWFIPNPQSFPRSVTAPLTEPLYTPIRAILRPDLTGGLDFSPLILIFALQGLARAIAPAGLGL